MESVTSRMNSSIRRTLANFWREASKSEPKKKEEPVGDIADYLLSSAGSAWEESEYRDDDGYYPRHYSTPFFFAPRPTTCQYCKLHGLYWKQFMIKDVLQWRLSPDNGKTAHSCQEYYEATAKKRKLRHEQRGKSLSGAR